jgi:hypothetical protein
MSRTRLREGLAYVAEALYEPEAFARRWQVEGAPYPLGVFIALAFTAMAGTVSYGLAMGLPGGAARMFQDALSCTVAAGLAWALPLPALYILNSITGSRLRASTTFLAALVTTSWGGLALIASVPIALFFTAALPQPVLVFVVHLVVFAGVGVAMVDVFARVVVTLEPARGKTPVWWLGLVSAIGAELFYALGLFHFPAV